MWQRRWIRGSEKFWIVVGPDNIAIAEWNYWFVEAGEKYSREEDRNAILAIEREKVQRNEMDRKQQAVYSEISFQHRREGINQGTVVRNC